jgi:hypothetical protein
MCVHIIYFLNLKFLIFRINKVINYLLVNNKTNKNYIKIIFPKK